MIVLDTNMLSELMRPQPDASVLLWIEAQPVEDLYISAMTMAEILHGIARLPHGKRKQMLHASALAMFEEDFIERIVPCLLYTSPSPRDLSTSRMPSSA